MTRSLSSIVLMLLPALLLWFVFMLGPALWGISITFTNKALTGLGASDPRFVGLENYRELVQDPDFRAAVVRSFLFVMGSALIGQGGFGLLLAVLTNERRRIWRTIRISGRIATTACYLSWVIPEAVIGLSWISYLDYDGVVNQALAGVGIRPIYWLVRFPMLSIILANTWWGTGWSMMLFKAALASIPREIEESAQVDGAGGWQRFRHVMLPLLRGPILVDVILITIWTYGVLGLPLMLTGGGPGHRSELMTLYAYRLGLESFDLSYGTTVSVGILLVSLILAFLYSSLLMRERP